MLYLGSGSKETQNWLKHNLRYGYHNVSGCYKALRRQWSIFSVSSTLALEPCNEKIFLCRKHTELTKTHTTLKKKKKKNKNAKAFFRILNPTQEPPSHPANPNSTFICGMQLLNGALFQLFYFYHIIGMRLNYCLRK